MLRLRFAADVDTRAVAAVLASAGFEVGRSEEREATLFLTGGSLREDLRRLFAVPGMPEPRSVAFGELSLTELYRALYGAEGV